MAESMKFGPEWLRNMSQDGNPSGPTPQMPSVGPKYQLADYRYGREEMLALYDEQSVKFSDTVLSLAIMIDPMLYTVEVQTPLSFIPMTEEDTRVYNRSFNSRGFSNTALGSNVDTIGGVGGKPLNKSNTSPLLVSPSSVRDSSSWNRFSGVERGRGRGGPGASYHTRPGKDGSPEMYNNTIHRHRFGVSADMQSGRGRADRNLIPDPDSKKEAQGLNIRQHNVSSGAVSDTNWRRLREEDEPWRPNFNRANSAGNNAEKWGNRGSWRQQAEQNGRSIGGERDADKWEKERANNSKWEEGSKQSHQYPEGTHNMNNNGATRFRRYSFNEENLPEWATENLPETRSGTFDSNGAYHGMYSDDEMENPVKNKDPNNSANRFYSAQSRVLTSNIYEDSISASYRTSNSPNKHFETISPTPHMESHPPSLMKPNEIIVPTSAVKETQDKVDVEQHSLSKAAPPHKNSVLEPNNRPDSNELMNQRLSKVVDDIDRLITEEDTKEPQCYNNGSLVMNGTGSSAGKDKWLYKDPQGNVQGPFTSTEMAEWYRTGYFRSNLLVKRMCDEVFSPLGDLLHFFGNIPFLADNSFPPIKASDHIASQNTKPLDEALLIQEFRDAQYKQALMSQQQQLVDAIVKNLRNLENWSNMSILEQNSLIMQHLNRIVHTSNLSGFLFNQTTTAPINIPPSNPIMQLVAEMTRQETHFPSPHNSSGTPLPGNGPDVLPSTSPRLMDPHLNLLRPNAPKPLNHVVLDHPQANATPKVNPMQMFLRQNHVWGVPGEKDYMQLDANNYQPQQMVGAPEVPNTQGETQFDQLMHMLIREDIDKDPTLSLSSQQHSVLPHEEAPPPVQQIPQPCVRELSTPEAVDLPQEKSCVDDKKKKQQEEIENERRERERKQRAKEEELQKKQEEEKKKEEEKRKKIEEQKRKKEEKEKLKKQEEERQKKLEEEKLLEELKKKENEEKRKVEQQRQEEALRKLVQQQLKEKSSNKTWTTSAVSSAAPQTTLADIQKLEKEQKQQQIKQQQQTKKHQKTQQQKTGGNSETPKASKKSDKSKEAAGAALKTGWTSQKPVPVKTKSIAEIQAEQTEQLAKQLEKDKLERLANPQKMEVARSKTQIWGSNNARNMSTPNYAQASIKPVISSKMNDTTQPLAILSKPLSGFWDEPVKILSNPNASKNNKNISSSKSSNNLGSSSALSNNKKLKKEEIKIKEIFTSSALKDSSSSEIKFINWCTSTLTTMKINDLDIPTFIGFLKEIESPKEVKDYVKLYIGEGKQAINFAKQYLEKRQACESDNVTNFSTNNAIKAVHEEHSKSKSHSQMSATKKNTEFVEVKAKNKKNKKGKMRHIDTTLLGFSVTAPPDRFNVGERELPDV